jgi:hypothetical protein
MTTSTLTVTEFVEARLSDDEAAAEEAARACEDAPSGDLSREWQASVMRGENYVLGSVYGAPIQASRPTAFGGVAAHIARHDPARVLAQCAAMRKIVELHASWPVLVQTQPDFTEDASDPTSMTFRMTQQIAWTTQQEYRDRFGEEPPTAPMIRALASIWSDHPDWREEWR